MADGNDDGVPVDRGWAWVICLVVLANSVALFGFNRTMSVLFIDICQEFSQSATVVSLSFTIGALTACVFTLLTSNVFMSQYSVQVISVTAAIINALATVAIAYVPSIIVFLILFAFKGAMFGCLIVCPISLIGFYFKKRRSLAMASTNAGYCVAMIAFPQITEILRMEYGLRGCLLMISAIEMQLIIGNMLLRSPQSYRNLHRYKAVIVKGDKPKTVPLMSSSASLSPRCVNNSAKMFRNTETGENEFEEDGVQVLLEYDDVTPRMVSTSTITSNPTGGQLPVITASSTSGNQRALSVKEADLENKESRQGNVYYTISYTEVTDSKHLPLSSHNSAISLLSEKVILRTVNGEEDDNIPTSNLSCLTDMNDQNLSLSVSPSHSAHLIDTANQTLSLSSGTSAISELPIDEASQRHPESLRNTHSSPLTDKSDQNISLSVASISSDHPIDTVDQSLSLSVTPTYSDLLIDKDSQRHSVSVTPTHSDLLINKDSQRQSVSVTPTHSDLLIDKDSQRHSVSVTPTHSGPQMDKADSLPEPVTFADASLSGPAPVPMHAAKAGKTPKLVEETVYIETVTASRAKGNVNGELSTSTKHRDSIQTNSRSWWKQIFDWSLFENWRFRMLVIVVPTSSAINFLYIYLPVIARERGVSREKAAMYFTVMGVLDLIFRVLTGFVADFNWVTKAKIVLLGLGVIEILCHTSGLFLNEDTFVAFTLVVGVFGGFRQSLMAPMVTDYVGLERMAKGYAFCNTLITLFLSANHPVVGALLDATGNVILPLHYVGLWVLIAVIALAFEPFFAYKDKQQVC